MKKTSYCLLLVLSFTFNRVIAQMLNQTDRQEWGVTNNIVGVHETFYNAVKEGDQIKKGKKISDKYEIESKVTFDSKGNKIDDIRYDMTGNPSSKITYAYDDKNNCTSENRYNLDGTLAHQSKFSYKYDEVGKILEVNNLKEDGSIKGKTVYKYDNKGNFMKEWFAEDGTSKMKIDFVRDLKGNITSQTEYDAKGKIEWKIIHVFDNLGRVVEESSFKNGTKFYAKYTYAYDEKGNKSEMHWFDKNPDKPDMNWTYIYEYDANGNWTKQIQYNGKKAISVTERELQYNI